MIEGFLIYCKTEIVVFILVGLFVFFHIRKEKLRRKALEGIYRDNLVKIPPKELAKAIKTLPPKDFIIFVCSYKGKKHGK